ncbi:exocyst complex component EXO70H1-like, partial [Durio zibethinus]|uniref:Exocyst subunit Exo70 family protein n=1 Tax=Durio zibethinus TaxID=66656 RepID=A0A6P5XL92_DURZI
QTNWSLSALPRYPISQRKTSYRKSRQSKHYSLIFPPRGLFGCLINFTFRWHPTLVETALFHLYPRTFLAISPPTLSLYIPPNTHILSPSSLLGKHIILWLQFPCLIIKAPTTDLGRRIGLYSIPRKGMRNLFSKSPSPTGMTPSASPLHATFSESLMEENIEAAEFIITKWDSSSDQNSYCNITSLFSDNNREEVKQYLSSLKGLQKAMQYLVSHQSSSEKLVRAQTLMQTAMKRLEKEFYQMLKSNRDYLDPESVSTHSSSRPSVSRSSFSDFEEDDSENESRDENDSIPEVERISLAAMADLRVIAEAMISAGYAKECINVYKIIRKSIVDEALFNLGVERTLTFQQIQKMDWEVLEVKMKNWLNAVKMAVKTLFLGERILCDQVFSISPAIRESCFTEVSKEGALALFGFPEYVAKCKKSPEKMFRILDLYEAVSDLWPEIESIFSFESSSTVRSAAVNSLIRLGDAVRTMLTDFETAIQKDSSKSTVPGGGLHPLTRYVMNYICFLADYSGVLSDIVADWPLTIPSPLPESYFGSPYKEESTSSTIAVRLAWLILVMLCKLDGKATMYKDVALSYLFLANNLQYVVGKVRQSNLKFLLGDDWVTRHELNVKKYTSNYERMGWSKVLASLPENPTAEIPVDQVKDHFRKFNFAFEEAYMKQTSWVIPDPRLRDDVKISLARRIVPIYKDFYERYGGVQMRKEMWVESLVRHTPNDLGNYLSDLFYGSGSSGSVSSSSSRGGGSR